MEKLLIWESLIEKCTICGELWSVLDYARLVFGPIELSSLYFKAAVHYYYNPVNVRMDISLVSKN